MSLEDLQRRKFVGEYDIILVSDECYADLYTTEPPHSILECGLENVLALHSLEAVRNDGIGQACCGIQGADSKPTG